MIVFNIQSSPKHCSLFTIISTFLLNSAGCSKGIWKALQPLIRGILSFHSIDIRSWLRIFTQILGVVYIPLSEIPSHFYIVIKVLEKELFWSNQHFTVLDIFLNKKAQFSSNLRISSQTLTYEWLELIKFLYFFLS